MYWSELRTSLKRTVAPTIEPVTVSEQKLHSRMGTDAAEEDSKVANYLAASREMVEVDCRVALCTQTWTLQFDQFPVDVIEVPIWPLQGISSISYVDTNGATQTWSSSNYIVNTANKPGRITLAYGMSWPVARYQENAITVTFVAGFGAASDVPQIYKQAIRLLAGECVISGEAVGALNDEQLVNYRAWIARGMWSGGSRRGVSEWDRPPTR